MNKQTELSNKDKRLCTRSVDLNEFQWEVVMTALLDNVTHNAEFADCNESNTFTYRKHISIADSVQDVATLIEKQLDNRG